MLRPRPYISFSQMTTYERSKEAFVEQYINKEKQFINRNMAYGSKMADALEHNKLTGDPVLDLMMERIPKFEQMDQPVVDPKGVEVTYFRGMKEYKATIPVLKDKSGDIPLLAFPDTSKADYTAFKEYKTSVRPWKQEMVDDSGQITFYATAMWLTTGKIPQDIELVDVPVQYIDEGQIEPTGDILRFPTKRSMTDIIKMTKRIRNAWAGIQQLCEKELL